MNSMSSAHGTNWGQALAAGAVGALTLTGVHQLARRVSDTAPRMDVLGERAIARAVTSAGGWPPAQPALQRYALAGDVIANSIYFSLVACGRRARVWQRGVAFGLAAGAGALLLPRRIGLGAPPRSHHVSNQIMTVAWYLIGGLAAAAAGSALQRRRR